MSEMQNGTPLENGFSEHDTNGHVEVNGYATPKSQPDAKPDAANEQPQRAPLPEEDNEIQPSPNKRRKLTDAEIKNVTAQRPISPPWKRVTVEGPTSFVEGGRRKSSRTNYVPVDLQPQTDKRKTRGAPTHIAPIIQSKYGGASVHSPRSTASSAQPAHNTRRAQNPSDSTPKAPRSPGRPQAKTLDKSSPTKSASESVNASKRPYKRRVPAPPPSPKVTSTAQDQHPPEKRRPGRPPSAKKIQPERPLLNGWHQSDEIEFHRGKDDRWSEITGERKPQRLNLRFRAPVSGIQHPEHVVRRQMVDAKEGDTLIKRPKFSSFEDWLEREGKFGLETGEMDSCVNDEDAYQEALLRNRIADAAKPGGLLSQERCTIFKPDDTEQPARLYYHQDRLVTHARFFQKLMARERTFHLKAARECAEKAAAFVKSREEQAYQEWKQVQPKTAEEIAHEQDELFKDVHVQLKEDVKRKWLLIGEQVESHRLQRWEAEQERIGNEALNEVIENARGSLKRRRQRHESGSGESDQDADSEDSQTPDSSDSDSQDESNMSASQSDSEEDDRSIGDGDEALTVEQLRLKYAARQVQSDASVVSQRENDPSTSQHNLAPQDPPQDKPSPESSQALNASSPSRVEQGLSIFNEDNASVLDETDHSTNMDDDENDESDDSSTSGEEEEASDDSEDGMTGLLGFYGRNQFNEAVDQPETEAAEPHPEVQDQPLDDASLVQATASQARQVSVPPTATNEDFTGPPQSEPAIDGPELPQSDNAALEPPAADSHLSQDEVVNSPKLTQPTSPARDSSPTTDLAAKTMTTPVPSLLRGNLREYQHYGLDWLAKLYKNNEHGILADEMGLGKTIQTIALLAHLALEYQIWGPHLIVVPTSVMLNWEMEFKKFLPGFKVQAYYGTTEERKKKRHGWTDNDLNNVWITSYQLVLNDQHVFKRKAWHYMVLDEAHNIKNFQSQRWQTLLTFNTHSRLLLTGTPLQNNLSELWSLLFFLQPEKGLDLESFNKHFKRPESQILENGRDAMTSQSREMVTKLHEVLRPHLLRRLKADVEKQLPGKFEHVVYCRLSKRQRYLYDGFMSRAQTRESLASGNTFSIMNALMQLRKVCNHPDLFETHAIKTSFAMPRSVVADFEIEELLVRRRLLREDPMTQVDLNMINLLPGENESLSALDTIQRQRLGALGALRTLSNQQWQRIKHSDEFDDASVEGNLERFRNAAKQARFETLRHNSYVTSLRSQRRPLFSSTLLQRLKLQDKVLPHPPPPARRERLPDWLMQTSPALCDMVKTVPQRSTLLQPIVTKFACVTPKTVATDMVPLTLTNASMDSLRKAKALYPEDPFHEARIRLSIAFPDKRLLQYDCGKLQRLDTLLRTLQSGGHRALIFTQMTKVLDILEQFLNIHGHRYLRLDGTTKVDQRQALTERFNIDSRILAFILSSRSGGIGINLTGADTVIFYDMDWNPAMDKQCQDRCHRIGQTRDVHIYRMISEHTIEANILRKANQKRMLDDVVIQEGDFTTDYFNSVNIKDVMDEDDGLGEADAEANAAMDRVLGVRSSGKVLEQVEDVEDSQAAKLAEREIAHNTDAADFDERGTASAGASTPKTPATPSEAMMPPPPASSKLRFSNQADNDAVERTTTMDALSSGLASASAEAARIAEDDDVDEMPSCDDYMMRFLEWELKDVPVVSAEERKRRKKAKKGKEHLVARKR